MTNPPIGDASIFLLGASFGFAGCTFIKVNESVASAITKRVITLSFMVVDY